MVVSHGKSDSLLYYTNSKFNAVNDTSKSYAAIRFKRFEDHQGLLLNLLGCSFKRVKEITIVGEQLI